MQRGLIERLLERNVHLSRRIILEAGGSKKRKSLTQIAKLGVHFRVSGCAHHDFLRHFQEEKTPILALATVCNRPIFFFIESKKQPVKFLKKGEDFSNSPSINQNAMK